MANPIVFHVTCSGIGAPGEGLVDANAVELFTKFCQQTKPEELKQYAPQIQRYLAQASLSAEFREILEKSLQNIGPRLI